MRQWTTGTSIDVLGDELVVAKRRQVRNRSGCSRVESSVSDEVAGVTEAEAAWLLAARGEAVVAVRRVDPDAGLLITAMAGQHTLRTFPHQPTATASILRRVAATVGRLHRLGLVHGRLTVDHVVLAGPALTEPVLCSPDPSRSTAAGCTAVPPEADLVALVAMACKLKPSTGRPARRWQRVIDELRARSSGLGPAGAVELFTRLV